MYGGSTCANRMLQMRGVADRLLFGRVSLSSFSNELEKDMAGCRTFNHIFIVASVKKE